MRSAPPEVGPAEVGPAEVGLAEVGPAEVGPAEVGPTEVGLAEVGPAGGRPRGGGLARGWPRGPRLAPKEVMAPMRSGRIRGFFFAKRSTPRRPAVGFQGGPRLPSARSGLCPWPGP